MMKRTSSLRFLPEFTMPSSNSPVRKWPVLGNYGDFVEAVFRPEIFWIFSGRLLPTSCGFWQEPTENHWKKSKKILAGMLLPRPSDFRCFPAGHSDFPASFLQGPAGSGDWNLWPGRNSKNFSSSFDSFHRGREGEGTELPDQ